MHAVGRIAYRGWIDNIQVSWVKLGRGGAVQVLQAGANDIGGTLMDENISRAAGASHGTTMDEAGFRSWVEPDRPHDRGAHHALRPARPGLATPVVPDDRIQELLDEAGTDANRDVLRDILRSRDRAGRRRRRSTRPEDHRRGAEGDAGRLPHVPTLRRGPQGHDLRLGPHPARRARSTRRPATSPPRWPPAGWMVITGAGPGIMAAGAEGAGPEQAIGVSIRLPFEEAPATHWPTTSTSP